MAKKQQAKINEKEKTDILDDIKWREETVSGVKEEESTNFKEFWKLFSGRGYEKLHIPKTYTHGWVVLSKFINTFLMSDELYQFQAMGGEKDHLEARIKQAVLNAEVRRIPDFKMAFIKHALQNVVDGWTAMKAGWDFEDKEPGDGRLMFPFIQNKNITFDQTANLNSELQWVHHKVVRTRRYLEALGEEGIYQNVKEFLDSAGEYKESQNESKESNPYKDMYGLLECWDQKHVYTVGLSGGDKDSLTLLRRTDNPYKRRIPIVISVCDPELSGMKGFGVPELMGDLNEEIDTNRRLRVMAIKYAVMGFWSYTSGALNETTREVFKAPQPGSFFPLDDFNSIKRWDATEVPRQSFMDAGEFDSDIEETVGTYRAVRGKESVRKETLGEHLSLQSSGSERMASKLLIYSFGVTEIGKFMLQNLFVNHSNKRAVEVMDGVSPRLVKKALKSETENAWDDYDVRLTSNLSPHRAIEQAQLEKVFALLKNPDVASSVDWDQLGRMAIESVKPGWADRIFNTETGKMLNTLRKLPVAEQKKIVNLGLAMVKTMEDQGQMGAGSVEGAAAGGMGIPAV